MNASTRSHLTEMGFSKQDVDRAETAGCTTVDEAVNFLLENTSNITYKNSTLFRIAGTTQKSNNNNNTSHRQHTAHPSSSIRDYFADKKEDGPSLLYFSSTSSSSNGKKKAEGGKRSSHSGSSSSLFGKQRKSSDADLTKALAISKRETGTPDRKPSEDKDTQRAIEESLMTSDPHHTYSASEPFDPARRKRSSPFTPVGLRNVANICYVNSLLQVYFTLPAIRKAVFSFRHEPFEQLMKDAENQSFILEDEEKSSSLVQLRNAVDFIVELQNLFGRMALTEEKYLDPQRLIETLKSDSKYGFQIGGQQDASEFNQIFLELLELGVSATSVLEGILSTKNKENNAGEEQQEVSNSSATGNSNNNVVKNTFTSQLKQEIFVDFRVLDPQQEQQQRKSIKVAEQTHETNSVIIDATTPTGDARNLYRGLDEMTCSEIEFHIDKDSEIVNQLPRTTDSIEFFHSPYIDKGKIVDWTESSSIPAYQRLWFVHVAPVLTIYMQRVRFNKETFTPEKVHDAFYFPDELKMSHYLEHQKETADELRAKSEKLKQQLQATLQELNEHRWFGFPNESLQQKFPFMETLKFSNALNRVVQRLRYLSEHNVFDLSPQDIESCLSTLNNLYEKELDLERELVNKKQQLEEEQQHLRASIGDENTCHLHAVLVRDGAPDSGHYWAFIKDWCTEQWHMYNDIVVNPVSWDQVLLDSVGGNKFASAYGIIYVNDELVETLRYPTKSCTEDNQDPIPLDCKWYNEIRREAYELLPDKVLDEIKKENDAFISELNQYDMKRSEQEWKEKAQILIYQAQESLATSWKQIKQSDFSWKNCLLRLPNFCLATEQYDLAIFLQLAVCYAGYSTSLLHDIQQLHKNESNAMDASNSLRIVLQMGKLLNQTKDSDWLSNHGGYSKEHDRAISMSVASIFSDKDLCQRFSERLDSCLIAYRLVLRAMKACEQGYQAMLVKDWIYSLELWNFVGRKYFVKEEENSSLVSKMLDNFLAKHEKGIYRNIQVCLVCLSEQLAEQLKKHGSEDSSVIENKGVTMARYATSLLDRNDPVLHFLMEKWASLAKESNNNSDSSIVATKVSKQFYLYRETPPTLTPVTLTSQLWDSMMETERYAEDTLEAEAFLEKLESLHQRTRGSFTWTHRDGLLPLCTLREWSQYLLHLSN
ncbi:hypothetical protein GAYE_SCF07G2852 [Galdieria yellowstonensis]|uniref:ubiquitinyl hydrolase 1 n=1 Tax=Galdieria yellowstonensis TaxID=3028027 RepID=A0AAV9IC05_9RHOD|nr:hypothetical protein GAYE_SCF07G2852 [Galdieria yellowstonensis]